MSEATRDFCSIDTQGFLRVAVAVPRVAVANPQANLQRTLELARRAGAEGAAVVLFPELGLSGYAIGDLVHQGALEGAVEAALEDLIAASADLPSVLL
ncbi:MAG TPA: nitrilase-related carbon-nitrogen hydrolase, partial [Thermoanaerobaculia bacterium]|nr:nitrilase-related carbon-nitrogen hydrolase [Thermoanaerobaculia bacterium]